MLKDDFEVMSTPADNERALEIFFNLIEQKGNLPLAEIKKRTNIADGFLALLNTAVDLAAVDSNALFRKKDDAEATKTSIWLSMVLSKARDEALKNSRMKFSGLSGADLRQIATLSSDINSLHSIREILLDKFGIILIFEKAYASMKLDGVTTKLPNGTPVIGLSFRYSRYDYFWFTLLHELAHISLHYDQLSTPIYDDLTGADNLETETEVEANRLAADSIVPRKFWAKAAIRRSVGSQDLTDLNSLSQQAEVHPALVAGLLRKSKDDYTLFSRLVNELDTRKFLRIE